MAMVFEVGMAVVALGVGRFLGFWPALGLQEADPPLVPLAACGWGVVATLPLVLAMVASVRWPVGPLKELLELVDRLVVPLFAGLKWPGLAVISAAAGIGEELLFRGLMQAGLATWIGGPAGPWLALAAASIAFGLCHSLSRGYAVAAVFAGVYFGLLLIVSGSIVVPMVAHGLYDFAALLYLTRRGGTVELPAAND